MDSYCCNLNCWRSNAFYSFLCLDGNAQGCAGWLIQLKHRSRGWTSPMVPYGIQNVPMRTVDGKPAKQHTIGYSVMYGVEGFMACQGAWSTKQNYWVSWIAAQLPNVKLSDDGSIIAYKISLFS